MKKWHNLTVEKREELYNNTLNDVDNCCDDFQIPFDEADGICPKCGRVTSKGHVICGCNYSFVVCTCCGATPCDGSC